MKKALSTLVLAAAAMLSQTASAAAYTAVDVYDPVFGGFFNYNNPLSFQHDIRDNGFNIGDTITSATLAFDFTNDLLDFDFFALSLENVTAWYDGMTWNVGEVDNGVYLEAVADLSLLADGVLNVTLRTAKGNSGAWLDSSTLTVGAASVPEPATLALLGLGLTGLGVARSRARTK